MQSETTSSVSETFAANRAIGAVRFDVHVRDGLTRRRELHEEGSLRVRFPSPEQQGLSAVFVNTAGGIAGGDRFDIDICTRANAQLTVTTAAAEKLYRSHGPESHVNIKLCAETGSRLAWLPQETILFDQSCVSRSIDIDVAEGASLLLCEIVVFGRAAMGETMTKGRFVDRWRMRLGDKLAFAETVRLDGDIARRLASRAVLNGGGAIGTALIVPGDEAVVERIRASSDRFGGEVGISAWDGFAIARFCAQDAATLRADMMTVLGQASPSGLPRLWLN
ncbi:urease accessory protein UreD [Bradyrhizobium sp. SYSU BS000235]|uniref:urease accessory protein UreD n=1 Tax=Bradyrhizobium sp. SYSU BS000235 TaxID=3411332 RepID=UPI003C73D2EC